MASVTPELGRVGVVAMNVVPPGEPESALVARPAPDGVAVGARARRSDDA